jgi:AcrR family transcriptional regulator
MQTARQDQGGRAKQKARTRKAIVDACRELTRSGAEVTMSQVAELAMVSEATAYRYFPDLVSLLRESLQGLWPDPADALAPVALSADPVERVAAAAEYLFRGVHAYQGSVRAMISHTIAQPASARARPGIRFGLIDYALAPFEAPAGQPPPEAPPRLASDAMTALKRQLSIVVSAEAFFTLTDLCGLLPSDAIAIATDTAATLTRAAFAAGTPGHAGPRI